MPTEPKRDLREERHDFEERLAICMVDGGLSREDALLVADQQLQKTIRDFNSALARIPQK